MRAFHSDQIAVPLPPGHRFPMDKYADLRRGLLARGVLREDQLHPAPPAPVEALLAVHSRRWVRAVLDGTLAPQELTRLGFPWSPGLVARSLASVGGTLAAARAALREGLAGNLAGGTHHALHDAGAGWCVFNDLAVATRALLDDGSVARVLVLDLDVHQGDGTAALLAAEPRAFTVSLHGARNFPARKQASDLDVPLPDGTGDEAYLAALRTALDACWAEHARAPFGLLLYQAGVDPLAQDRLGRMALSHAGLRARDRHVLREARAHGLPVALTLGGGYAEPIAASVEAHVGTWIEARAAAGTG